jgi:hypothetical protein
MHEPPKRLPPQQNSWVDFAPQQGYVFCFTGLGAVLAECISAHAETRRRVPLLCTGWHTERHGSSPDKTPALRQEAASPKDRQAHWPKATFTIVAGSRRWVRGMPTPH